MNRSGKNPVNLRHAMKAEGSETSLTEEEDENDES